MPSPTVEELKMHEPERLWWERVRARGSLWYIVSKGLIFLVAFPLLGVGVLGWTWSAQLLVEGWMIGLFWGAFINGGQTCAALKRLYVHDDVYDEVCEELVKFARKMPMGNGVEDDVVIGPVQNLKQYDIVSNLVEDAEKKGRVLLGGRQQCNPQGRSD